MSKNVSGHEDPNEFSLVAGGAFFRLLLRSHLVRVPTELLVRRIVVLILLTWFPLLALSIAAGHLSEGVNSTPFLQDLTVHCRFLVALPLLLYGESLAHRYLGSQVSQFLDRGLIRSEDRPRFEGLITRARKLRNSLVPEIAVLVFVMTGGHWIGQLISLDSTGWFGHIEGGRFELSPAGFWYSWVSLPVLRFLLCRWYFRLIIWAVFLWRVSRLPLDLNGLHPDRTDGLGFLARSVIAFYPVLMAHSANVSGWIGNRIWHRGARLPDFKFEMTGMIIFLLVLILFPLLLFAGPLVRAREEMRRRYGILASQYVGQFREKWIHGGVAGSESILGSADVQSLADLSNSYDVMREMRILPFGKDTVIQILIVAALPLLPLVFTMIPAEEILHRVFDMLL